MPTEELFGNYMLKRDASDTFEFDFVDQRQDGENTDTSAPVENSLTITINGVQDTIAEDYDYPHSEHDDFYVDAGAYGFTATDDLWKLSADW